MAGDRSRKVLDFEAIIRDTNLYQKTTYSYLKDKQKEALQACTVGDVACVLPTGFGKTVVIHMLPHLVPGCPGCILVVTPLNAIMEEQQARFGSACVLVDGQLLHDLEEGIESRATKQLKDGKFNFLLGHPEQMVKPVLCRTLMVPEIAAKITHIVVDEAHCVLSWGETEFRPAFTKLSSLRASLPDAKMVALTATASTEAISEIYKSLHMHQPVLIKASPDRPTVYIDVRKRPPTTGGDNTVEDSYNTCLDPLLVELQEKEVLFPRTIAYLPLRWCGHGHSRAKSFLADSTTFQVNVSEDDDEVKSFVAQFHAPQTSHLKKLIAKSMQQPDGPLRLLFATEAYGMGADSPNVRRVVHVGPPTNLETYIQEIGRCGRDGQPAEAILYFNNSDLAANREGMTDSMREFCRLTSCRREYLMHHFGFDLECHDESRCCDVCSGTNLDEQPKPKPARAIPHISLTLQEYFEAENEVETTHCLPHIVTGLSKELADLISSAPEKYSSGISLADEFPFLLPSYIENIQAILTCYT